MRGKYTHNINQYVGQQVHIRLGREETVGELFSVGTDFYEVGNTQFPFSAVEKLVTANDKVYIYVNTNWQEPTFVEAFKNGNQDVRVYSCAGHSFRLVRWVDDGIFELYRKGRFGNKHVLINNQKYWGDGLYFTEAEEIALEAIKRSV